MPALAIVFGALGMIIAIAEVRNYTAPSEPGDVSAAVVMIIAAVAIFVVSLLLLSLGVVAFSGPLETQCPYPVHLEDPCIRLH